MYESASDYVNKEYGFLQHWSKRWAGETWSDLLTHFYLHIDEDWLRFNNIPDDEKRKWVQSWLRNTSQWSNTQYRRDVLVNNLSEEYDLSDNGGDCYIEILAEDVDDLTKEWIVDLHRHYSDRQVDLLMKVRLIYLKNLTVRERVLYDLIYKDQMTLRQVSNKIKLPTTVIFHAVKNLNKKIKDLCMN